MSERPFTPKGSYLMGRPEFSGKLSRLDVLEMLRLFDEERLSVAEIARRFGVVPSAAHYQISKRRVMRGQRRRQPDGPRVPGKRVTTAEHGTRARYQNEMKWAGEACAECREANRRAVASRRALAVSA